MLLSIDQFWYSDRAPSPKEWKAALECAHRCAFDPDDEYCVGVHLEKIRFLTTDCVERFFPDYLKRPGIPEDDCLVQIEWQSWSVPKNFGPFVEQGFVERAEAVVVPLSEVVSGQLEPAGYVHFEEIPSPRTTPPKAVFDEVISLIEGEWRPQVWEHAEAGDEFIDQLDPFLRPAVRTLMGL